MIKHDQLQVRYRKMLAPRAIQLFLFAFAIGLASCGGGGSSITSPPPAPQTVTVSVSPSSANVLLGNTQQFTAAVTDSSNSAVTWSVNGVTGGNSTFGSISGSGLYTPPATVPNPPSIKVTATSAADTSASASAAVSLAYPVPTASGLSPSSINAANAQTVIVTGSNFTPASTVQIGTASISSTFVSSTQANTAVAGVVALIVTNPSPGGGPSSSLDLTVVPVLLSITPTGAAVGSSISVGIAGGDLATPTNNVIKFTQAGQTIATHAVSASAGANAGTVSVVVPVPTGLSPSTIDAGLSAPAVVTTVVDLVSGQGTQTFSVQPPPHAIGISPTSAESGTSLNVELMGSFTNFNSSSTVTSDDQTSTSPLYR